MWQQVREELHPKGLEVVTVAMDTGGAAHAKQWIDAANPSHPSLIDADHRLAEVFGVVNVPSGIWIDEDGVVVRPPHPAWPGKSMFREVMKKVPIPEDADPYVRKALEVTAQLEVDPLKPLAALRDWADNGPESPYALSPDEVLEASRPRPIEHSEAAAHFELGSHLWQAGETEAAVEHFKAAHRLQPDNWTYKRQAWQFVSPVLQNAREVYGTDWATEVAAAGPKTYYSSDL